MSGKHTTGKIETTLLIVIGVVLGGFFLYLAFRGITWSEFADGMLRMKPVYLIHATVLLVLIQLLRALRFGLILSPFCPLRLKDNWDLVNIWGGLNMLMPARLAELVRPYLLHRAGASFSSSIAAVMVERFFDMTALLTLLAVVLWTNPKVPRTYSILGAVLFSIMSVSYLVVLVALGRRELVQGFVDKLLGRLPDRASSFLGGIVRRLLDGFLIMASARQALMLFLYSVLIWTSFACVTYVFLLAFSIEVPFLVAVTIQVLLCFGVALPAAPGFVGTFHAVGRYALTIFGVGAVIAVSFATVYHLYTLIASVILAILSYWTSDLKVDRSIVYLTDAQENGPQPGLTEPANAAE